MATFNVPEEYSAALVALRHIAASFFFSGRFHDALRILKHAEEIAADSVVSPQERAAVLIQMGEVLTEQGSFITNTYDLAVTTLRRAEQIARTTEDQALIARALDALGMVYYQQPMVTGERNFEQAAVYFQHALALQEVQQNQHGICESRFHVGLVAERQQRFVEATAIFSQVYELAAQYGFEGEQAEAARHLGFAHMRAGRLAEALRSFQESLALFEAIGFTLVLPFAHLSIGEALQAQGKLTEAMDHYQTAYGQAEATGLRRATIQVTYSIGEIHEAQHDMVQAREWYTNAYELAKAMGFKLGLEMCSAKLQSLPQ